MAASMISYPITLRTIKSNKLKLQRLKVNGAERSWPAKVAMKLQLRQEQDHDKLRIFHQKKQTKKQLADQAMIVGDVYRQTVVVRSYEVGPDGRATVETMIYLLQEIAMNHMLLAGFPIGSGHAIWVTTRLQLQVEQYFPIWGEVLEIDTWFGPFGKSGLRRNWVMRSQATGRVLARAVSLCLMVDPKTRRHSNIPDELRDEVSPWFAKEQTIQKESHEKIDKLDNDARFVHSDIKVRRCDLDMNHHVNNAKYVSWMLEPIPEEFLKNYQLCKILLEYRRECRSSDLVQSLCEPQEDGLQNQGLCSFTHQVQIKGETENQEALRGKTTWKLKNLAS